MPVVRDEILLSDTAFWVTTRGRCYGPFDYQWSNDLRGVELTYQDIKFGEICSHEELFADLSEFQLPMAVCRVATITAGTLALGIAAGECSELRVSALIDALSRFGFERFHVRSGVSNWPRAAVTPPETPDQPADE